MDKTVAISVRNLVESVMLSGDIDNRGISYVRAQEGTWAHQYVQRTYGEEDLKEVRVAMQLPLKRYDMVLSLSGRIDGVKNEQGKTVIEEIKSTVRALDEIEQVNALHLMQVKCYAYMYAVQHSLDNITMSVLYFHIESKTQKKFYVEADTTQLEAEIIALAEAYAAYMQMVLDYKTIRNKSIRALEFPFTYRIGQHDIMKNVYQTFKVRKKLFLHAPTGSGKTISTLFPAIKYIDNKDAKIFYLTSKGTQKQIVHQTLEILQQKGLEIKALFIEAKDKVCFNEIKACDPEDCIYARGYYDKVKDVIGEIFKNESLITREVIASYAQRYSLCPFELSLDISMFSDLVVCDYNYVFDPQVALKRYFEERDGEYLFLVDEAHNLAERARGMYSAQLDKEAVLAARRSVKGQQELYKAIGKINTAFLKALKAEEAYIETDEKDGIFQTMRQFTEKAGIDLRQNGALPEEVNELYLAVTRFLKLLMIKNDSHKLYYNKQEKTVNLLCLDSAGYLRGSFENALSAILFSATLMPMEYFMKVTGGEMDDYSMICKSPFDEANLTVFAATNLDLTYRGRGKNVPYVADYIYQMRNIRQGNYIAFFPSFEYLQEVCGAYLNTFGEEGTIIRQTAYMNEAMREEFVAQFFKPEKDVLAFAVLGGAFAESIDLVGDSLIGCVIVSVGLPKVCYEREHIKQYYDEKEGRGFDYAYSYEGINKILQAAGRVIRSSDDKGAVLLLDKRFLQRPYRQHMENMWGNIQYIINKEQIQ